MAQVITKDLLKELRKVLQVSLAPIEKKFGLALRPGRATYSQNNFTLKIEGSVISPDGSVLTKEAEDFKSHAMIFGLQPEDLGRKFWNNGQFYEVIGLAVKSHKYPILAKTEGGKVYKFTAETIKAHLAMEAKNG